MYKTLAIVGLVLSTSAFSADPIEQAFLNQTNAIADHTIILQKCVENESLSNKQIERVADELDTLVGMMSNFLRYNDSNMEIWLEQVQRSVKQYESNDPRLVETVGILNQKSFHYVGESWDVVFNGPDSNKYCSAVAASAMSYIIGYQTFVMDFRE